jgi:hypothetical protein
VSPVGECNPLGASLPSFPKLNKLNSLWYVLSLILSLSLGVVELTLFFLKGVHTTVDDRREDPEDSLQETETHYKQTTHSLSSKT